MKKEKLTKILSVVLAALLLCLLITQLLPFWKCSDCKTHKEGDKMISIAEYIMFPLDHKPLTEDMMDIYKALYGDDLRDANGKAWKFAIDDILICPLLVFIGCVLGIILCLTMENKLYGILSGAVAGISGVMGYLLYPPLQVGPNWQIHLVVAALVAVIATLALVYMVKQFVDIKRKRNRKSVGDVL